MASLIHCSLTCLDPPTSSGSRAFAAVREKNVVAENFSNEILDDFYMLLAVM